MGRQGCPTAISFSPDDKYVTFLQSEHGEVRYVNLESSRESGGLDLVGRVRSLKLRKRLPLGGYMCALSHSWVSTHALTV
eukprot:1339938-Amorphochlora_amoeboformis.AAC.1